MVAWRIDFRGKPSTCGKERLVRRVDGCESQRLHRASAHRQFHALAGNGRDGKDGEVSRDERQLFVCGAPVLRTGRDVDGSDDFAGRQRRVEEASKEIGAQSRGAFPCSMQAR